MGSPNTPMVSRDDGWGPYTTPRCDLCEAVIYIGINGEYRGKRPYCYGCIEDARDERRKDEK